MPDENHFTSVRFRNFKAFKKYSVSLRAFNVLVGPNNSGKSTILGAFRILSEGIRKASARKPEYISGPDFDTWGYRIPLGDLPIATENIFTDYHDSEPAFVKFRLSNGNHLQLYFPAIDECLLICETSGPSVRTPTQFKRQYGVRIGFVPILGPVEHNEPLYKLEAARLALLSHRASRNFRNIWYHYPEDFSEFQDLVRSTWPGMDIEKPELDYMAKTPTLHMFCPEERYPREIFWAGFGFQVWCQMLTHIVRARDASLFIIDEPDIYLHSDLQRQLVAILKTSGPDILIATHSTEIISEAEPDDLLIVNKKFKSAKRIKDPNQLQSVFSVLGSNLNPTLTQLAKSKRALFVEGKDFQILSSFARKLGKNHVANRSDFAVIPVEGFNSKKVGEFTKGMELTLGAPIIKGAIFDRDYRSESEVKDVLRQLNKICSFARILERKEIENYLLEPEVIKRAITRRVVERNRRGGKETVFDEDVSDILQMITEKLKVAIQGQYLSKRKPHEKRRHSGYDDATINANLISQFDDLWRDFSERRKIVPGKQVISMLNQYLQGKFKISISRTAIVSSFRKAEIPDDIVDLINGIDDLTREKPSENV